MRINITTILLAATATLLANACGDSALDKKSENYVQVDNYYRTVDELSRALTGAYAILQSNNLGGREYFFLHDLRSDDVTAGGGQLETPRNQLLIGSHGPTNAVMTSVYNGLFRLIHRANAIIQNAPEATGDAELKKRLVAESRFLRAWAYYQLAGFWGGVPLYTATPIQFEDSEPQARSSATEIWNFVYTELNAVVPDLPEEYNKNDFGRAGRGAALMVLAKAYIFNGDYTNAKTRLEAIKDLGYTLTDNYFDNFTEETEYNQESIFELSYTSGGNYNWDADGNATQVNESWIRSQEYSAVGWRNLIPSNSLLAEYEPNDPRLKDTFYFIGDTYGDPGAPLELTEDKVQGNKSIFNGVEQKVSWKKYSVMYKLDPGGFWDKIGINYRMYRYADVLLMLAECENEVGSPDAAIDYLNEIRNRPSVNMLEYPTAEYPVNSQAEITRAIIHERRVELAGEEVRNFDILRWRKDEKLATEPISYYAPMYELLPLPQDELNNNPNITQDDQNQGY
ncbi:RagB/SusD family nutrient uptake outer membrane protein [Fulvivirgaceae bacterium PWU5]|uniref:RagB/SusD family nutrient uptake outer membrane protein n=1 Tax=Dawidia cretensis TaxID=2782350 RepID=A0AAP2DVI4_9BACT|nr:RagB/SusD family nutrient uptake outer membrane protein [Dawidia cretensis]MBT1708365.1 RagB/SusD family nutrient uptake outer membrane protein [Dawidia cretensis]